MQSRTCSQADHQQKEIEYLCTFPNCLFSRLLCSECVKVGIHKHELFNFHILDNEQFHQMIAYQVQLQQDQEIRQNQIKEGKTGQLKLLLEEMQNQIRNILKIIKLIEEEIPQLQNYSQQELTNIQQIGFSQLDEQLLNKLLFIFKQQQQQFDNTQELNTQLNLIIQNAEKIKKWTKSFNIQGDCQFKIYQLDDTKDKFIQTNSISNDLKYIVSGGEDKILKIWDYDSCQMIKQIHCNGPIGSSKFTDDSQLLYIGDSDGYLYQFDVKDQFNLVLKQPIHIYIIMNIYCISNHVILTSSYDKTIIKTDLKLKQQLFTILAHDDPINGLDYHINKNLIVSGSWDHSIKIWNGEFGKLLIDKQNAHNNQQEIWQVIFICDNQLISNSTYDTIIWNINFEQKHLEQSKLINAMCSNLSLALNQFIIVVNDLKIMFYSIQGDFINEIPHKVDQFCTYYYYQLKFSQISFFQYSPNKINGCHFDVRIKQYLFDNCLAKLQVCKIYWD